MDIGGRGDRAPADARGPEEAIREREAFIRSLGDNLPDGMLYQLVREPDGTRRYTYVSEAVQRLHGCTPAEALADASRIYSTVHPEDARRVVEEEEAANAALSVFRTEIRILAPDGTVRWSSFASQPRLLPDGATCWDGVELDITERRRAEEVLRRSEESYRRISRLMSEYVFRVEVGPDGATEMTFVSEGLARSTGRALEDVRRPDQWARLVHPADRDRFFALLRKLVTDGGTGSFEGRFRRGNGTFRTVQVLAEAVRDEAAGRTTAILGAVSDVTARRAAEQEAQELQDRLLAVNQELASALRLKDEFLSSMSHELRTPLNAILGFLQGLRDGVYGGPEARQLRAAGIAEEAGRHLLDLISDILDLSKVQAGRLALEPGVVPVRSLCETSLHMVEKQAERKRVRLDLDLDPEVPTVVADGRRLKQIVVNLLSNAVKFTREEGHVRLSLRGEPGRGAVAISVADDGIGIAEEALPRLFRPFTQVESGLARRQEGTGLGLSLVLGLTTLHGGGVEVRSRPGEGSVFTVRLPWSKEAAGKAAPPPSAEALSSAPAGPGRRGRVLVVEDNEANAVVLCDYLSHAGFATDLARSGLEALGKAKGAPPDVVLMDVQMPGMDGLETTRRLRSEPGLESVPVLAVTALAMPGDRERCLDAGANGYLTKPLDLPGLVAAIEKALDGGPGGAAAPPPR